MYQHQGIHAAPGDHRGGSHGLAECGRRAQHSGVVVQHRGHGCFLIQAQRPAEGHVERLTRKALIAQIAADAVVPQQVLRGIQTAARQRDVVWVVFSAADHPGLVPDRHSHRLRLVELGVLECGEANQPVGQRLRQLHLLEVNEVGQRHRDRLRHRRRQPPVRGGLPFPRRSQVLLVDERHIERMRIARGAQDGGLDVVRRHRLNGCQERPLVGMRLQCGIDEYAVAVLPGFLLQRQGDQVAEAAFGHRVLVGEQAVVGRQLQLPGA